MTNKEIEEVLHECKFNIQRIEANLHDIRCMIRQIADKQEFVSQDEFYSKSIKKALAFETIVKNISMIDLWKFIYKNVPNKDHEFLINQINEVKNNE